MTCSSVTLEGPGCAVMDVIPHLKIIAVLTAVIFVATAAPAPAAVLTGVDRAHGARFSLSPRTLTITLAANSSVRGLAGQQVAVTCEERRHEGSGISGTLPWPQRSRTLRMRFAAVPFGAPVSCSVDTASRRGRSLHAAAVLR